jgi:nucleoside-diphosphate-sugar epimerase
MIGDPDALHSYAYLPDVACGLATLGEHAEADGRVWHLPSVETRSTREILRLAGQIAGVEAKVSTISPLLLGLLARVNPVVREVRAVGYQLYRPFVVDSSAFENTFGVRAAPLDEALRATVEWYRTRAREPRKGRGAALAKGLGAFALDNVLIVLAILAVRSLVSAVPELSVIELGIAVAAGLYGFRRCVARRSPSSAAYALGCHPLLPHSPRSIGSSRALRPRYAFSKRRRRRTARDYGSSRRLRSVMVVPPGTCIASRPSRS